MTTHSSETRPARAQGAETDGAPDREAAARVLRMEADGLRAVAEALDGRFPAALDLLGAVEGRIIVSGMGKSGLVGAKIAATLASVGTPAQFVHPAEASHGDLGMITSGDAVLAISNSGETAELSDLVAYTKRFSIPLVGITSRAGSTLAREADVALVLPAAPEACPLGLAPTTSTTMTMALGDAIAVSLLERKGFTADQFQVLHPGGKLGRSLLRVSEVMHTGDELPLAERDTPMSDALITMTAKRFGCVGVVAESRLTGIVTDGDLRRHMADDLVHRHVEEVMTHDPKTIRPGALAAEALGYMNANAITSLFVVEDGEPVGIVHVHDLLRAGVA